MSQSSDFNSFESVPCGAWSGDLWSQAYQQYYKQRYNANGRRQVMYSDGSIVEDQAEDPRLPRYTQGDDDLPNFGSLNLGPRTSSESHEDRPTAYSYSAYQDSGQNRYTTPQSLANDAYNPSYGARNEWSQSGTHSASDQYSQSFANSSTVSQIGSSYYPNQPGHREQRSSGSAQGSSSQHHPNTMKPTSRKPSGPKTSRLLETIDDGHDSETLDPSFRRVKPTRIKDFFREGRVLALLWVEPSGAYPTGNGFSVARFGENSYAEIRRFIVVRSHGKYHSICVPIMSYQGQGAVGRVDMQHHSIAHTTPEAPSPLPNERLVKKPIYIDTRRTGEVLNAESRVNFSKLYTIEHNLKVKEIGIVPPGWMTWVSHYYDSINRVSQSTAAPDDNDQDYYEDPN